MKFSLSILFAIICWVSVAQPAPTPSTEAVQLKKLIAEKHLEPGLVDNDFSRDAFNLLLGDCDPEHLYFLREEIDKLNSMHDKIDNDLNLNSWVFFPLFVTVYEKALQRAEKILMDESSKPFDLGKKDVRRADTTWCADDAELRARWRLILKSETLQDMGNARKSKSNIAEKEFLSVQEPVSRKKAQTARLRAIRRIVDHPSGFHDFVLDMYYNALSNAFDPHTVYFSPTQMENFLSALSSEGYYFGFSVRESRSGEIEIANLLPGGPAWKSGEFHSGDVIEKLRWEGKEWMDLAGVTEAEVDAKLSESNQSAMEFVLRKSAGLIKTVRLRKEKLNTEESMVKGFVLSGKKKIGYISLPDFYSSWGDNEGAKCAGDVAAEILKLRKQNIEGLILDVRYNGGGSLLEAMNMTGIFIDAGPVGVERVKGMEPFTLKDSNRGTVYDGPLVIMVNGVSASASELVSAALQDYRRAIIVGSNTYGKATAQEMFSLRPG
ncbi:MAG TPA: S41 family peptidase, partial [Sphingobacteriaceae bacterium]